ncbi:hypothetical protein JHK87_001355 [Glycine soja]|nr:hypothetical protein JHK87_001355 [Glycine soja]
MVVDDAPPVEPATIANPLLAQYQTVHEAKMREMHEEYTTNVARPTNFGNQPAATQGGGHEVAQESKSKDQMEGGGFVVLEMVIALLLQSFGGAYSGGKRKLSVGNWWRLWWLVSYGDDKR